MIFWPLPFLKVYNFFQIICTFFQKSDWPFVFQLMITTNLIPFFPNKTWASVSLFKHKICLAFSVQKTKQWVNSHYKIYLFNGIADFAFSNYWWKILPWNSFSRAVWDPTLAAAPRDIQWLRLPTSEAQRREASYSLSISWNESKYKAFTLLLIVFHYHDLTTKCWKYCGHPKERITYYVKWMAS